jgi:hypothetical protein
VGFFGNLKENLFQCHVVFDTTIFILLFCIDPMSILFLYLIVLFNIIFCLMLITLDQFCPCATSKWMHAWWNRGEWCCKIWTILWIFHFASSQVMWDLVCNRCKICLKHIYLFIYLVDPMWLMDALGSRLTFMIFFHSWLWNPYPSWIYSSFLKWWSNS